MKQPKKILRDFAHYINANGDVFLTDDSGKSFIKDGWEWVKLDYINSKNGLIIERVGIFNYFKALTNMKFDECPSPTIHEGILLALAEMGFTFDKFKIVSHEFGDGSIVSHYSVMFLSCIYGGNHCNWVFDTPIFIPKNIILASRWDIIQKWRLKNINKKWL
jgi:hypothetical protein